MLVVKLYRIVLNALITTIARGGTKQELGRVGFFEVNRDTVTNYAFFVKHIVTC